MTHCKHCGEEITQLTPTYWTSVEDLHPALRYAKENNNVYTFHLHEPIEEPHQPQHPERLAVSPRDIDPFVTEVPDEKN